MKKTLNVLLFTLICSYSLCAMDGVAQPLLQVEEFEAEIAIVDVASADPGDMRLLAAQMRVDTAAWIRFQETDPARARTVAKYWFALFRDRIPGVNFSWTVEDLLQGDQSRRPVVGNYSFYKPGKEAEGRRHLLRSLEYARRLGNGDDERAILEDLRQKKQLMLSKQDLTSLVGCERVHGVEEVEVFFANHNTLRRLPHSLAVILPRLKELHLEHNNLDALPDEMVNLRELTSLWLGHNNFRVFPRVIGALATLEILKLSHNTLQRLPDEEEFWNLSHLFSLDLDHNELTELPDSMIRKLSRLSSFDISNNRLEDLPDSMFVSDAEAKQRSFAILHGILLANNLLDKETVKRLQLAKKYNTFEDVPDYRKDCCALL